VGNDGAMRPEQQRPARAGEHCPDPVRLASMTQRWDRVTFVHFEYEPSDVAALLPEPLRLDCSDGAAWVGLVACHACHTRLTGLPPLPGTVRFGEVNVRTYVVLPDGTPGVYFFSLDAASRAVATAARTALRLPYRAARMSVEPSGYRVTYDCRRRGAGAGAGSRLTVSTGDPVRAEPLDVFLTARWRLLQPFRPGVVLEVPVEHDPWPLQQATVTSLDDTLVAAAGLPAPENRMVARYSPGVHVRFGLPRLLRFGA
jgi:uncharacterized protein